jgi:hypothetical protein
MNGIILSLASILAKHCFLSKTRPKSIGYQLSLPDVAVLDDDRGRMEVEIQTDTMG